MAPTRTHNQDKNAEASSSKSSQRRKPPYQAKSSSLPSKQKLKSSLRQARRLLAKENLAADVRVATERKLKALEAELQQADQTHKERALAVRYHKIKFFERQKVTRKLNQTKKRLQSAIGSEKEHLATELLDCRVNLNYILHYPKTKKYISLFPPEVRKGEPNSSAHPSAELQKDSDKTCKEREEVRSWIRACMERNELPVEPELHLGSIKDLGLTQSKHMSSNTWSSDNASKIKASSKTHQEANERGNAIQGDDFFGNDSDAAAEESDEEDP